MDPVDLLVFGPHPDDLEIGAGGTVAKHAAMGLRVGLVDLTQGEMGSNGTVEERLAEAEEARTVLGAAWRTNLRWPDRAIGSTPDHALAATELIRRVRPKAIALPYWSDRHPDHVAASNVLTDAIFDAGLFVVDVTDQYETKRRALACHKSQFNPSTAGGVQTRLTSSRFKTLIESRDAQFGVLVGVDFAEGFVLREPVLRPHLLREWRVQNDPPSTTKSQS
ncbi:MAG: bacillithiol biosynthesis deacetylase BshB1 [Acidobacteria bacterium]|nr:MAG: bacillithiol biosynthesis deacetylase BshB1 [Acidobacteriota bacterium]